MCIGAVDLEDQCIFLLDCLDLLCLSYIFLLPAQRTAHSQGRRSQRERPASFWPTCLSLLNFLVARPPRTARPRTKSPKHFAEDLSTLQCSWSPLIVTCWAFVYTHFTVFELFHCNSQNLRSKIWWDQGNGDRLGQTLRGQVWDHRDYRGRHLWAGVQSKGQRHWYVLCRYVNW